MSANGNVSLVRTAPVIARLAVAAGWRATGWTIEAYLRVGSRLVRGAANGESPAELIAESGAELRDYVRKLLGVEDDARRASAPAAPPAPAATASERRVEPEQSAVWPVANGHTSSAALRERGAELLRQSADVDYEDDAHPAYAGILSELAPDEGRILRLLAIEGQQPSVDVRTGGPLSTIKSELVAPGLTMIGAQAGCRHPDRIHPYLNNLFRLGLIWFSREPLEDPLRYQVLEAQPEVLEAMQEAGRGKTVRRSIELTPFGQDFCRTCLPLDTADIEALPGER